jgi:hypothetical protein
MAKDPDQTAADKAAAEQAAADQAAADDKKAKADAVKAARKDEAQRRIENESTADIGLDRRKDHEHEMAARQAQEQIDAEAAAKK